MSKTDRILTGLLTTLFVVSVTLTFYQTVVKKHFTVVIPDSSSEEESADL